MDNTFWDNVRKALKYRGWKVAELARRMNTVHSALSMMIKGERGTKYETMVKVAEVLEFDVSELCSNNFSPEKPQEQTQKAPSKGSLRDDEKLFLKMYNNAPLILKEAVLAVLEKGQKQSGSVDDDE